jgi:excisionase family DNA binding protein
MTESLLPELLTAAQVAELLQLKRTTLGEYARRAPLPSIKLGRHRRRVRADVEAALAKLRTRSATGEVRDIFGTRSSNRRTRKNQKTAPIAGLSQRARSARFGSSGPLAEAVTSFVTHDHTSHAQLTRRRGAQSSRPSDGRGVSGRPPAPCAPSRVRDHEMRASARAISATVPTWVPAVRPSEPPNRSRHCHATIRRSGGSGERLLTTPGGSDLRLAANRSPVRRSPSCRSSLLPGRRQRDDRRHGPECGADSLARDSGVRVAVQLADKRSAVVVA